MSYVILVVLVLPFVAALVAAFALRRPVAVAAVGLLVVPAVFFGLAYLTAENEPGACSDCGEYGGRFWEPWLVAAFTVAGWLAWGVGSAIGGLLARARRSGPDRRSHGGRTETSSS